jgi:hypothetical protein
VYRAKRHQALAIGRCEIGSRQLAPGTRGGILAFGNLRPPDLAHLLEYKFDMSAKIISNDNIIYEFESDDRLNRLARILIAAKLDPSRREAFIGNNEIFNEIIHGILKYNTNKYSPSERKEKLYLGDPEGWKSDLNEHQVQETFARYIECFIRSWLALQKL